MQSVTTREHEVLGRIFRRIDRRATFEAFRRPDGDIDLRFTSGRFSPTAQVGAALLDAAGDDVVQFEMLRGKIKRVFDRMRVPPPPPKIPKVEIQKDIAFGFRPGAGRGRR